jgi:hypothetical protein
MRWTYLAIMTLVTVATIIFALQESRDRQAGGA